MPPDMHHSKKAFALPVPGMLSHVLSVLLLVLLCLGHWESRPAPELAPSAAINTLHKADAAALLRFVDRSNGAALQAPRSAPAKFTGAGTDILQSQQVALALAYDACEAVGAALPVPARRACHANLPRAPPAA